MMASSLRSKRKRVL